MALREPFSAVRYVTDANGEKTDVVIPLSAWKMLLASWNKLAEALEDQEDRAILQEWMQARARGEAETISLEELERELIADGLIPG